MEDVLSVLLSAFCISEAGDLSDLPVLGVSLRPLVCWNGSFESVGNMNVPRECCVGLQVEISASG